jgi:hypothetical protein
MTSDFRTGRDVLQYWLQRSQEVASWAAANPELAAAWDDAIAEDEHRERMAALERSEREILASAGPGLRRMGVPAVTVQDIEDGIRGGFRDTLAMRAAQAFTTSTRSLLLLFGGPGAGKTVAACWCLLRARSRKDYRESEWQLDPSRGMFVRGAEIARLSRFDDRRRWEQMLSVRWLVVDDLGAQAGGDYMAERLDELIDTRYSEQRRTVITCNIAPGELRERLGDRIVSRIRGSGLVVGCGDEDLRRARQA